MGEEESVLALPGRFSVADLARGGKRAHPEVIVMAEGEANKKAIARMALLTAEPTVHFCSSCRGRDTDGKGCRQNTGGADGGSELRKFTRLHVRYKTCGSGRYLYNVPEPKGEAVSDYTSVPEASGAPADVESHC